MIKPSPKAKPGKGHNSGPVVPGRLKSFVERIERVREDKQAAGSDERDIFTEAKSAGYDAATLRWILKEREVDSADRAERDALRETYAHALGMAVEAVRAGMSYREAEQEFGFSRSAIHRASHQTRDDVSGTVGMTADDLGSIDHPVREMTADDLGDPLWVVDRDRARFKEKIGRIAASIRAVKVSASDVTVAVGPSSGRVAEPIHDDLALPSFLDVRVNA